MALTDSISGLLGNKVNLPIIGALSIPVLIGGGLLLYLLLKKKRVTSVTTRYGKWVKCH